jgi:hypothetical protein
MDLWSRWPGAGVCVVLGYNNVVAVDIDSDTPALVNEIESVIGKSPVGKIGRRGITWFFRADPSITTARFKLPNGDGVDFLAKGAQTVIPCSIHPDTKRAYVWQDDSLENYTPEQLQELPPDIAVRLAEVMKRHGWAEPPKREPQAGDGVWASEKAAAMDTREQWLSSLGFTLDRYGKRMNAAWRGSEDFNVAVYPDGFHDHVANRQMSAIDVVMEMRQCSNREALEWLRPWIHIEEPPPVVFDFKARERVEEKQAERPPKVMLFEAVSVFNLETRLRAREWLYDHHYQRGFVTGTLAMTKVGKSTMLRSDALAMVTGFGGIPQTNVFLRKLGIFEPLRVLYCNGEDPLNEVNLGLAAICKHFRVTNIDIGGRLHIVSGRDTDVVFVRDTRNGTQWSLPTVDSLKKYIVAHKIDVVILDPAVKFHRLPEVDNGKMDEFFTGLADLADELKVAIEVAFHPRKLDADSGISMQDLRGAISQISAIRSLRTMRVVTSSEATNYSINDSERELFVCLDNGGANMLPPGKENERWLRRKSVTVEAYLGDHEVEESVGVLEGCEPPWLARDTANVDPIIAAASAPPEPLTELDEALLLQIQDRVRSNKPLTYSTSANGPGKVFTRGIQGGKQVKARRAEIEASVDRLIEHGKIHISVDRHSGSRPICIGPPFDAGVPRDPTAPRPWGARKKTVENIDPTAEKLDTFNSLIQD